LIEEKHIISAALVAVEVKGLKSPTRTAICGSANQRLKNRILSRNKPIGGTQHVSARESAAKEATLADLP
jgi:hypothetical protein